MQLDPLVISMVFAFLRIRNPVTSYAKRTHCTWKRRFGIGGVPVHRAVGVRVVRTLEVRFWVHRHGAGMASNGDLRSTNRACNFPI